MAESTSVGESQRWVAVVSRDRTLAAAVSGELARRGFATAPWPTQLGVEVALIDADRIDDEDLAAIERLRAADPLLELVLLAGGPDVEEAVRALRSGVFAVLEHPVSGDEVAAAIAAAAERHARARRRIRELARESGWSADPPTADGGGSP